MVLPVVVPPEGNYRMVPWSRKDRPYYVYEDGRVYSTFGKGKWLKMDEKGRVLRFQFTTVSGRRVEKVLHKVVADCFIPNPDNLKYINFKDQNTHNCSVSNLEWSSSPFF
jgi:hypothetical protein